MESLVVEITLVVLAVVLWIIRQARQGRFAWITGRTGSTALVFAGLALLIFLPLLGVLLLVAGIMAIVRRTVLKRTVGCMKCTELTVGA